MTVLPSQQSAQALALGVDGAWLQVALHTGARAFLIGAGAAALGVPEKYWVKAAVGGSVAIEVFVLAHELWSKKR